MSMMTEYSPIVFSGINMVSVWSLLIFSIPSQTIFSLQSYIVYAKHTKSTDEKMSELLMGLKHTVGNAPSFAGDLCGKCLSLLLSSFLVLFRGTVLIDVESAASLACKFIENDNAMRQSTNFLDDVVMCYIFLAKLCDV